MNAVSDLCRENSMFDLTHLALYIDNLDCSIQAGEIHPATTFDMVLMDTDGNVATIDFE